MVNKIKKQSQRNYERRSRCKLTAIGKCTVHRFLEESKEYRIVIWVFLFTIIHCKIITSNKPRWVSPYNTMGYNGYIHSHLTGGSGHERYCCWKPLPAA